MASDKQAGTANSEKGILPHETETNYHATMDTDAEDRHVDDLRRDQQISAWKTQARKAARTRTSRKLYVITLHPDVLDHKEFRHANPGYIQGMPCVYVGMTVHEPGDRYQQHKTGYRSSKYPRRYGIELAMELIDGFDQSGMDEAAKESALANWLRQQGIAVWQN